MNLQQFLALEKTQKKIFCATTNNYVDLINTILGSLI